MRNKFTSKSLLFLILIFIGTAVSAQNGLENVIVEKYYVSNADDSVESIGILPSGSVTYRVYLDLRQGYEFQTAFGSPEHTLFINTTTSFFNNEDRGATYPNYSKSQAKFNTVMLDSWLTAGAACNGNFGVLKSEDDGLETVVNADGILQNNDPSAGVPLTEQDGLLITTPGPGSLVTIGVDDQIGVFDATSQAGNSFTTNNGAWACLLGAIGPDTTNKVLIGQFTTDGTLTFEINIQIGTPDGSAEQYVPNNAAGAEILFPALGFNSTFVDLKEQVAVKNESVSVYPNPTQGLCNLELQNFKPTENSWYSIYNQEGTALMKKQFSIKSSSQTEQIDLSNYPAGIYFIQFSASSSTFSRKIVRN